MIRTHALAAITLTVLACSNALQAADDNHSDQSANAQGATAAPDKTDAADKYSALFDKLDANHDGQITSDEVPEEQRRLFERLLRRADRNGDGKLSREEFIAGMKEMEDRPGRPADRPNDAGPPELRAFGGSGGFGGGAGGGQGAGPLMGMAIFRALDTNGDGKLDAKEIAAAPEVLKKLANSNGEITRTDLLKSLPGAQANGFGGGRTGLGRGGGLAAGFRLGSVIGGGPGQGELNPDAIAKRIIQQFDKNGDGKLQKSELPPPLQEWFDELDTNHDGALDEAEIKAILPRLMRRLQEERAQAGPGGPDHPLRLPPPDAKGTDDKMPADNPSDSK